MATVEYPHIAINAEHVPVLTGTQTKVVEIVLQHLAYGSDAQEIHREFPHLSLAQIYSALAYYYDHKAEVDEDIERRVRRIERLKAEIETEQGESAVVRKLRALGRLP